MARQSLIPFGLAAREPLTSLHREMNRLFDDVFREGFGTLPREPMSGGLPTLFNAAMNVSETEKEVRVSVELPGVMEKDIDVSLADDTLTIRGEKRVERSSDAEQENYHYIERSYGKFQRSVQLPFSADADQVRASFQNGVLTVTVPKNERQSRMHKIQVQGSGQQSQQLASNDVGTEAGAEEASHAASPSAKH
jgi:HSP20 family protein